MQCLRCPRHHSGPCGIPAGVTLGFGARRISANGREDGFEIHAQERKKKVARQPILSTPELGEALVLAVGVQGVCRSLLLALPHKLPLYDRVLQQYDQAEELITRLRQRV